MKKYLQIVLLLLFTGMLYGCSDHAENVHERRYVQQDVLQQDTKNWNIVIFDKCQYIVYGDNMGRARVITHKGNCSNQIHIYHDEETY